MEAAPPAPASSRLPAIVTTAAVALMLGYCVVGIVVPAGLHWDFANFYDAGHRVAAGQSADLYQQHAAIDGASPQGEMRFWSAPLAAAFLAPLSWLSPEQALIAFKIENALAIFLALALLYRATRRFVAADRRPMFAATFAAAALLFQPFWTVFRVGGQTTPTVVLLLALALTAHVAGRWLWSAALLGVVVMLKPSMLVMLLFLAAVSGVPFLIALAVAGTAWGLVSLLVFGWPLHEQFVRVLIEGNRTSRPWVFNSSLYVPLENIRLRPDTTTSAAGMLGALEWTLRLAIVGLFASIVRRSRRTTWQPEARRHFEFQMAMCFWLLFSLLIWEHYLAVLFITLSYLLAVQNELPSRARMLVAAIVLASLGQNLIPVMFVADRFAPQSTVALLAVGLLKAAPLLLLTALLAGDHHALFETYRLPPWRHPGDDIAGPLRGRAGSAAGSRA